MDGQTRNKIPALESPADPQSQSLFFRLPLEIRCMIYHLAFPRLRMPHHVYLCHTDDLCQVEVTDGLPSRAPIRKHVEALVIGPCCPIDGAAGEPAGRPRERPAKYRALMSSFQPLDPGFQRLALYSVGLHARIPLPNANHKHESTHISSQSLSKRGGGDMRISECHRFESNSAPLESVTPPSGMLLSCRRFYQEVVPLRDGTFTFADLRTLEIFLLSSSPELLGRVRSVHLLLSLTPFHGVPSDVKEEKRRDKVLSKLESMLDHLVEMKIKSLNLKVAMEVYWLKCTAWTLRHQKRRETKEERLLTMKGTARKLLSVLEKFGDSLPESSVELDRGMARDDRLLLRPLRGDEIQEPMGTTKCQICGLHEEWAFQGWRVVQGETMSWPCQAFCWGHL